MHAADAPPPAPPAPPSAAARAFLVLAWGVTMACGVWAVLEDDWISAAVAGAVVVVELGLAGSVVYLDALAAAHAAAVAAHAANAAAALFPMAETYGTAAAPAPAPTPPPDLHTCGVFVPSHADVCSICLEQRGRRLLLPCLHAYHPHCIREWFVRRRTCPLCGQDPWFTPMGAEEPPTAQTMPAEILPPARAA